MNQYPFSQEEWEACIKVLTALKEDPFNNPDNLQFKTLITSIHKKAKKDIRKSVHDEKIEKDIVIKKQTTIVSNAHDNTTFYSHQTENTGTYTELNIPVRCYACSEEYKQLHSFYHRLCPKCAEVNYYYRQLETNFEHFQVVITGGRVKIGYATALKFLRSKAKVLITTRFPANAWEQFSKEPDFECWQQNLTIYGLDLRNLKAVYQFVDYCRDTFQHIDILVNNAAQTIKYTTEYYQPLIAKEQQYLLEFRSPKILANETPPTIEDNQLLSTTPQQSIPINRFGQPVDYRDKNSWNSKLEEIGLEELLEVNLINHISPYLMISELKALILKSPQEYRFIINVTSSEGQFSYGNKTVFHPHTNMTKAALNMLTRTSGADFVKEKIYMNAVDVGWVSTGAYEAKRARLFDNLQIPPLDSVDGAMRIIHPILETQNGNTELYGKLLKNYRVVDW